MTNHCFIRAAISLMLLASGMMSGAARAEDALDDTLGGEPVVVKLVTFYPGADEFSIYGHTELRVTQGSSDYYYNYGVYDFNAPHFVYRFVKGDADYLCAALPARYATYGMEGRRMVEQELNLTQRQACAVRDYLMVNSMPGNNTYRYQYLSDNCSTRPRDIIEMALSDSVRYPAVTDSVTYRDMMSRYTHNYPWEQFGIDLVLGAGLDVKLDARQQMFIPMMLMEAMAGANVIRDRKAVPLVRDTQIMVDASEQGTVLPPTPLWRTPMAVTLMMLALTLFMTVRDVRRGRVTRWFDTVVYSLYAVVGCVLFYLMFCSAREATWPNYNVFWANPFMFLPALGVWMASLRRWLTCYHCANLAVIVLLALSWPWLPQVANPAFFPLMAVPALRSAGWLWNAHR